MQNSKWLQALIVLLVIIAAGWLFGQVWSILIQFSNIILLFFLAWLLAFILRPVARWLTRKGVPSLIAVTAVYLALALVFTGGGILLVPVITEQVNNLIGTLNNPSNWAQLEDTVAAWQRTLRSWGVTDVDLNQFYREMASQVQSIVLSGLQNTFSLLQSVATLVIQLILVLILSFYFMKDGDRIFGNIALLLPPRWRDELRLVALSIEKSFGGFVRGQLVFALVYAILTAFVMILPPFSLDFVVIASIVAGLCMLIPLVGNFLSFVPPMLVLLLTPDKVGLWPWFLLALFIMQSIMMNVLGPRIMSSAIGIHPLYVIAAILIGGQIAGVWGALFGIPVAGAINLIGRPLMRRIRHQVPLYQDAQPPEVTTASYLTGPLAVSMIDTVKAEPKVQPTPASGDAERATQPHAVLVEADIEEDLVIPPSPTLSARLVRLVFVLGSRAVSWARTQAHARVSRH